MGKKKSVEDLFEGRHFDREVIILCVRWYLRFKLSLGDLMEMMAERGLSLAHDFRLSAKRDAAAAKAFFGKAVKSQGVPQTITLDGYAASHRAVREMKADGLLPKDTKLRSSKYLNNQIEQDHRGVKLRVGPMLGFKRFNTAAITIAGIQLPPTPCPSS